MRCAALVKVARRPKKSATTSSICRHRGIHNDGSDPDWSPLMKRLEYLFVAGNGRCRRQTHHAWASLCSTVSRFRSRQGLKAWRRLGMKETSMNDVSREDPCSRSVCRESKSPPNRLALECGISLASWLGVSALNRATRLEGPESGGERTQNPM